MDYKRWDEMLQKLDDDIIDEAANAGPAKHSFGRKYWPVIAAACAGVVIVICAGWLVTNGYEQDPNPIVATNPEDETQQEEQSELAQNENQNEENAESSLEDAEFAVVPDIMYASADELEVLKKNRYFVDGMGGTEEVHGWYIIQSLEEQLTGNPTLNNVDGITELPVFLNDDGVTSSDAWEDEADIEKGLVFDNPKEEITYSYKDDGVVRGQSYWYKSDPTKDIVAQLLDYTFYSSWYNPPVNPGVLYPIISYDEAVDELRKGNFLTLGSVEYEVAETAEILTVELCYLITTYQEHLQPYYKFIITDDSWSLDNSMYRVNPEDYFSVSEVYVPAVEGQYLVEETQEEFNERMSAKAKEEAKREAREWYEKNKDNQ